MSKIGLRALILAAACGGVGLLAASSAQAACSGDKTEGNIVWISGCSSDNQANDGDDVPMYVDNTPNPVTTVDGSLNGNNNQFDNVVSTATGGDFESTGSGFANLKTVVPQGTTNNLTLYTFTKGPTKTLVTGEAYNGFDGELFRGQIDNLTGAYNGDLTVTVTFSDNSTANHTFHGLDSNNQDFGVLGFDENLEPSLLVKSVVISVAGTGGAWDEFKQINFSVPGVVASIPETSTWGMLVLGFIGLGYAAYRRPGRQSISALA